MTEPVIERDENSIDKALAVKDLVKVYKEGSQIALNKLSLSVNRGDVFGLLGPNGAGKTTAISIMSTLLCPTSGGVTVHGIDAIKEPHRVKKLIGLVPQDIALYPTFSAQENLHYFGRLYGLSGRQLKERILESLEAVGLKNKPHQRVSTYSGGMKRRLNLAIGILHRPSILFLDEPTVGIDAHSRNMILENILSLKKTGVTVIYTTHYMEEAEQLCSNVAIIDEGKIVAHGLPRVLLDRYSGLDTLGELFLHLTGKQLRD